MAKNGIKDATFDDQGQKVVFGAGAPGAAPGPMQQTVAPAAAQQPLASPQGDQTLARIQAANVQSMQPLNAAVDQALAALKTAAASGNAMQVQKLAAALQQARNARDAAAAEKFGNGASKYLESVTQ
jgi:hypothetical protein